MKIILTHLGTQGIKNLKIKSVIFLDILLKYFDIFILLGNLDLYLQKNGGCQFGTPEENA